MVDQSGKARGKIEEGIICFSVPDDDPSIKYYGAQGGTHFHERSQIAYTLSNLDTPVYREHLKALAPKNRNALIVDVGGGDGRNTEPWLQWGFQRIVLIDPIRSSLIRFQGRIAGINPAWLDRVVMIQADARQLPLVRASAARVLAIECICYLNEDGSRAVAECRRILAPNGQFLVSVRNYEASLLIRALYFGGVSGIISLGQGRDVWDGVGDGLIRNRCYTREEIVTLVERAGLHVRRVSGISAFSVVLSFLNGLGRLGAEAEANVAEVHELLRHLGESGSFVRTHVLLVAHANNRGTRTRRQSI